MLCASCGSSPLLGSVVARRVFNYLKQQLLLLAISEAFGIGTSVCRGLLRPGLCKDDGLTLFRVIAVRIGLFCGVRRRSLVAKVPRNLCDLYLVSPSTFIPIK